MITLRPYQERLLDAVRLEMRNGHHAVLAVAPTGSGKTIIAAELAHRVISHGKTIWFGVHRDFLVEQTSGSFTKVGVEHGFIAAGRPEGVVPAMVVAIDTLRSRLHRTLVKPDIFVFDEAHHCRAESWLKVWDWLGPQTRIIGLTATPQRLDGAGLGVIPGKPGGFSAMVEGPTTAELMQLGMLSGYRAFAPSTPDLSGVRTVAGDYDAHQLSEAVERSVIVGDVVDHWKRHAKGRKSVYFAVNIAFSKRLAEAFDDAGVPALHIDGNTPSAERVAAARALAEGRVQILVNVALMGEGFDLAAVAGMDCNVECVGLVRPTQSLALHLQQIGRALRPKADPAIILDHAGNVEKHGLPDDERHWSLEGRKKVPRKTTVKTCPVCLGVSPIQASVCVCCGAPFVVALREGPDQVDGNLVEIDPKERSRRLWQEVAAAKSLHELEAIGRKRGYKKGWAWYVWKARQSERRRPQSHDAQVLPFKKR